MKLSKRQGRLVALAVLVAMGLLLLVRLSAFGMLDPWELVPADQARNIATGQAVHLVGPPLGRWLVAAGFELFGVHEWSGRLPIALTGVLLLVAVCFLVARFSGWRAGVYAAVAAGTTPLFVLNAREMLGQTPSFLMEGLVGLTAASAVFLPTTTPDASTRRRNVTTALWLAGCLVAAVLAVLSRGALLGVLPPLAAVAVAAGLSGLLVHPDKRRAAAAWAVTGGAAFVGLMVLQKVVADTAGYSAWLGGLPEGGNPPTFEVGVAHVFHAFAPWSALAVVALARMLGGWGEEVSPAEAGLRRSVVLWVAFGYAALTLFLSRYGTGTWVAIAPLAAAVALLLRDVERSERSWWPSAVIVALFVGLLIRDYGLYPQSAIEGLPIATPELPKEFNPIGAWAILFVLFAAAIVLSLGSSPERQKLDLGAPYRMLGAQWRKGWRFRPWLIGGGLVFGGLLVLGLEATVVPQSLGMSTIALRASRWVALVLLGIPVAVAAGQVAMGAASHLGRLRGVPVVVAGALVGIYVAQGFLPAFSAQYSPRGVYDTFERLAAKGEPLGEYRVGSRAAAYYVKGDLVDLHNEPATINFLTQGEGRRWAVIPAPELPTIDRQFRQRTGRHLFVADATSAVVVLVANQRVQGHANESFLKGHVLDHPPAPQHPVHANFQNEIELLGYDLQLPHDGYVGAGESFKLTWYWKDLRPVPGGWQVFVHIDGRGERIHGDHDPVDGKYPVRLWNTGDIVVDPQTLTVPPNFRPGDYTIFVGFWMGENRLTVVEGPHDTENRVRAGVLRVR